MLVSRVLTRLGQAQLKFPIFSKQFGGATQLFGRYLHNTIVNLGETVQFKLADIGEGIKEVTIKEWYVTEGQSVSQFDSICEVQSDKAAVTITSRFDGVIRRLHHEVDDIALVGQALVDIEVEGATSGSAPGREEAATAPPTTQSGGPGEARNVVGKAIATPAVRRLAMENNISLSDVRGTGRDGRVLKEDVLQFIAGKAAGDQPPAATPQRPPDTVSAPPPPEPSTPPVPRVSSLVLEDRQLPIRGIMKAMTKTMSRAVNIPHFAFCDEVEMKALVALRNELKSSGTNISFMPFMIKAASLSLAEFPLLNSYTDDECQNVTMKGAHNIGVAMDTAAGLLVPNIKAVQELSILDIAQELKRLRELGQAGKLSTVELSGGTFTLSNIGNVGGTYTKPVILAPQVCIGGVGKIQRLPRFVSDDSLEVKESFILNVSWSADHRVVDGATMARFSNKWKSYLERPESMLLTLK